VSGVGGVRVVAGDILHMYKLSHAGVCVRVDSL
jgi:hypothetical protein